MPTNQKDLNEFQVGEDLILFLMVNKSEVKTARNGKQYLNMELRDKSAVLPAKVWGNFENLAKELKEGKIVKVAGTIEEYNNSLQIRVDKIRIANENDGVNTEEYLPKSVRLEEEMLGELKSIIESVKNKYLNELLNNIFKGDNLKKYVRTPAGKGWHHAYLHGLLEHTLEIVKICDLMCSFHSEINRDLLVSGALLHDFGKTEELTYEAAFDYSDKGKLLGHIVLGAIMVNNAADSIEGFPEELKDQLVHLVLSHQGKLEFASPVEPRTLEAIVLYQADELSAKTNAYKFAIDAEKNKGGNWTRFLPLANTSLYIPNSEEE